ncbi:hypothetical protein J4479_04035 [Candidatus Woesearchaeota archaeon]|nr:hypothetical protein [Candidatus Woesearchaeota archaeon]
MSKENSSSQTPYLIIVAVVAVVAVVTLVMNKTEGSNLQGAPVSDFVDGCFQSDTDLSFQKKGYVQVGSNKKWDVCKGDKLQQYYCDHNVARPSRLIDCQFGCENGVCLGKPTYG